jgi:mannose-6-phosphate isomerase-like protein (cupin superfamily)
MTPHAQTLDLDAGSRSEMKMIRRFIVAAFRRTFSGYGFARTAGFAAVSIASSMVFMDLLPAGNSPQYGFWTAAQMGTLEKKMYTEMDATKGSHENLMSTSNSYFMVFHREATAPKAEVHMKHGDFGVVRTGQGAILIGGKFMDGQPAGPNEIRGRIEGGTLHQFVAGDAFYIPASMPHQIVVEPGKRFNVEMLKVEQKDGVKDPTGFLSWNVAELEASQVRAKSKMSKDWNGVEMFAHTDSYDMMMNHKEGTAQSEIHVQLAEFQIIRTGEGAMMLGGKVVNAKNTGPNEVRGTSLEGATRQPLAPGDLLYIPANMPHHTIVDTGKIQDKLIVKVWVP